MRQSIGLENDTTFGRDYSAGESLKTTWSLISPWSLQEIITLKTLIDKGLSSREIGERMGRKRNSIIGQAHRQGLKFTKPISAAYKLKQAPKPLGSKKPSLSMATFNRRPLEEREKPTFIIVQPVASHPRQGQFQNVDLLGLEARHCRYPVSEHLFCGDRKQDGSSYCAHHHALCHAPTNSGTRSGFRYVTDETKKATSYSPEPPLVDVVEFIGAA